MEKNPNIPKESILVDDYEHLLYKNLGFDRFDENLGQKISKVDKVKLLGFFQHLKLGRLWQYAFNFLDLAPVEDAVNWLDLPEGGLRNGGTLIVKGEGIIYQWSDSIPSDVPDVDDVIRIARGKASSLDR